VSRFAPIAAASGLIVAAIAGWARPALTQGTYYEFCWTPATKQIVYVSAPFQTTEPSTAKLEAAYSAFIKKQYGYSANDAQCSVDLNAKARDAKRAAVLKQAQDGEVTAVTFTYTPAVVLAAAPAPPPPPALPANLDPGNLKDPWLQKAKDEFNSSKGYCETTMPLLHQIFDCDCFARLVFQFRVAHAGQYKESNRAEGTGWVGFSNILMAEDFVCTTCLEDARLDKYVHDKVAHNMSAALTSGRTTPAKAKAHADCVSPRYIAEFKAHPHVYEEQGNWNRASEGCRAP
jgi:hypothetical protein